MAKHWFVPKRYGWGFVPVSWEGWLMTGVLVLLLLGSAWVNGIFSEVISWKGQVQFLIDVTVLAGVFSWFSEKKMKGDLGWRWGDELKPWWRFF